MLEATVNGTRYAYIDEGSGPLLFFGHGLLASKDMFRAQIAALSDRYRCVSVDWPGHGGSGAPPEGWDHLEGHRQLAAAMLQDDDPTDHAVFDRDDIRDQIARIGVPTLVICGEEDVATVPEKAEFIASQIDGAGLVMIPQAGHHSALENPEPVTAAIERFLDRL